MFRNIHIYCGGNFISKIAWYKTNEWLCQSQLRRWRLQAFIGSGPAIYLSYVDFYQFDTSFPTLLTHAHHIKYMLFHLNRESAHFQINFYKLFASGRSHGNKTADYPLLYSNRFLFIFRKLKRAIYKLYYFPSIYLHNEAGVTDTRQLIILYYIPTSSCLFFAS